MLKYVGLGGAGLVAGGVVMTSSGMSETGMSSSLPSLSSPLSLLAKSKAPVNTLTPETQSVKWDSNWDKRDPSSLVKPLKENATDEEKAAYQEKLTAATSKANRIIVLVRHGQYNLQVSFQDLL